MGVRSHLFPLLTIAFYKWSIRNRISLEFWDILQYFVLLWPSLRDRQISCPKLKLIKSLVCYGLQPNLSCGFHQHIRNSQLWRQRRILCISTCRLTYHTIRVIHKRRNLVFWTGFDFIKCLLSIQVVMYSLLVYHGIIISPS